MGQSVFWQPILLDSFSMKTFFTETYGAAVCAAARSATVKALKAFA